MKLTPTGIPFKKKVVPEVKPLPLIVRLNAALPAGTDDGDRLVRLKPGWVIRNGSVGGAVCPVAITPTFAVPGVKMRLAGTVADNFMRTENRHDYAVPPPSENLLPLLSSSGLDVVCIGKIASIYDSVGVTQDLTAKNNNQAIDQTINALNAESHGLIFSNLVDFDMLYGHRRDTEGYARALEHFDGRLPDILDAMRGDDLLIITADHGNDPTAPGSDHTREFAPLLVYGKNAKSGVNLGTRGSLADIGQTIAENFGVSLNDGVGFLSEVIQ